MTAKQLDYPRVLLHIFSGYISFLPSLLTFAQLLPFACLSALWNESFFSSLFTATFVSL